MIDFIYALPTKMIFGKGAEGNVGVEVKKYSRNILLVHYGDAFIRNSGILDRVTNSLKENGIAYHELDGIQPNPVAGPVYKGIEIVRENKIDFILTIGGGSVIDTGKAVALGASYAGDFADFYFGKAQPEEVLPVGCITTIPASGSETGNSSCITFGEDKIGYGHELLLPRFAIFNPELTLTLPKYQTFCGIADIIDHMLERYFTDTEVCDLSDHLLEGAVKSCIHNARLLLEKPDDYDRRAEIMLTASVAHNGMLSMGRAEDWGVHCLGHPLSSVYGVTHGASVAIMRIAWLKLCGEKVPAKFVQFATRMMGVDDDPQNPSAVVREGIRRLEAFFKECSVPVRMTDLNIDIEQVEADIPHLVELSWAIRQEIGFRIKMTREEAAEAFRLALR